MKFRTLNSTYEVEMDPALAIGSPATGQARRLGGEDPPTPRQGLDGEWRRFAGITQIVPGSPVIFIWELTDGDADGIVIAKSTVTSEVVVVEP